MYGPYLLYCNHADTADACWTDAKAQADAEKQAWPYSFVSRDDYPTASQRGTVSGRLIVKDALKPELNGGGAWVGLAQPSPDGNWQFESLHYQFWTKANADGNFTIPKIRPGDYTLYAFTNGAVGEYAQASITVSPGQAVSLGDMTWNVPHHGKQIAWEIGVPDRTAKEFRHGDDYFHGYVWDNFTKEFSNPLEYTIGQSNPATDWNYAQQRVQENGNYVPHRWNIHFKLAQAPAGDATLVLAIASAQHATIDVTVNNAAAVQVIPSVQGGNALLRESIHAKYCVEYLSIPADHLHAGDNVISLALDSVKGADAHVMYDYLALELP
jgi:rhamnogalacturonan endolyase